MLPHVSSSSHRSRLLLVVGQNNAEPAAASAPFEEPKRREGGLEHWLDSSAPAPVRATDVRGGQLAGAHGAACVVTAARRFRPWTPVTDACVFTRSKSQSRAPNPPPPELGQTPPRWFWNPPLVIFPVSDLPPQKPQ